MRLLHGFITLVFSVCALAFSGRVDGAEKLNFVILFTDDQGYGDMSCNGHPTIHTPNLDRMATEGQKWTQFYSAAPVCTPSRAALLTGRLPIRSGMTSSRRVVLFPDSTGGLPQDEVTLAEVLKAKGYATACIGKWHLGHLPQHLPMTQGFDYYFGLPYSNDMDRDPAVKGSWIEIGSNPKPTTYHVPLMRNDEVIERPANQELLTRRYTEEAVGFIRKNQAKPFLLYVAHSMPHIPLFRSDEFKGKSLAGIYGDVIEEIDASVGRVLDTLEKLELSDNTIVLFTSDNGPWDIFKTHGGSAGLLRGAKGSTREGGMREPAIFWGPDHVMPGVVHDMGSTLDVFPTFAKLAGAEIPSDRVYDGFDLGPVLLRREPGARHHMFYYSGTALQAVRQGNFKAQFLEGPSNRPKAIKMAELYQLGVDPSEKYNVAASHPEVVDKLRRLAKAHKATVKPVEDQLSGRVKE